MKIGLSLSGGGARGIAHIGVLQAFEENGIEIDVLSGASAGSIVSALYAAGKSAKEILGFAQESKLFKLFKVGLPGSGLVRLTYLKEQLAAHIEEDSFEALTKPLVVAISNLNTGKVEMVDSGPLFDIVTASCSVPLIFKPVELNGMLYLDGGLLRNLPAKPLRDRCDLLIGVNVMPVTKSANASFQNFINIGIRCFELSIGANSRADKESCDILIEPQRIKPFNGFQFGKVNAIYEIGYQAGLKMIPEIKAAILEKK